MKKKILVLAPQFLGDGILSVPFFRNLRLAEKDSQIDVISKNAGKLILEKVPYIDNVYDLKTIKKAFLKEQHYQKVYLLKRSLSALLLVLGCGIKEKIGFVGQFRKPFLTKPVDYKLGEKSERDCFLEVLEKDGIEISDKSLEFFVNEEAENRIKKYLSPQKNVLVVAKASTPVKELPQEVFRQIVEDFTAQGKNVYFAGLESEKPYYESLCQNDKVHNLCGKLSFDEIIALVKNMDAVVGIDSGFCHLASAFDVKTFTIFGPMSIVQWGLLGQNSVNFSMNLKCSPCKKPKKCKKNFECLKKITYNNLKEELKNKGFLEI